LEFSPRQVIAVIERITEMDAATGWVVMVLQMITGTTAYLGDEATRELFSGSDYPLMAEQGTKFGQAKKVDGGYRLSGQWHFASGSQLADMIHTAAVAETGRPLIFTLPKSECTMVDNWDVMGLRATSSDDYTVEDVFVPDAYVYEVTTKIDRGEPLSTHQESLTRLSLNNAAWTAHDVCMTVYKSAGTTALREGDLQRYFRDMHAGTQHMSSGPGVLQQCGRQLAGLAEGSRWVFVTWCFSHGHTPLPAHPMVVAAYLIDAADTYTQDGERAYSPATLSRWVAAWCGRW
jgi:alkylation response protein AidB-like acyl-CoA dehydrogenase